MKFTDKVKKAASKVCAAVTGAVATAATTVTAWAADGDPSLTDQIMNSVQTGFNDAKGGIGQLLVIAIPVVIGVIVAVVLAKAAFGWIKTIGSKSK